jgi:anti-sigma factor RsiW
MSNETPNIDEHVVEQLSGYVDGELTQQQRQRIDVHCAGCADCARDLRELKELRESVGNARLSNKKQDVWREKMNDATVQRSRGLGWLLLVGGILACLGIGVLVFLFDSSISLVEKMIVGAIYGGLGLLFYSVLRQY